MVEQHLGYAPGILDRAKKHARVIPVDLTGAPAELISEVEAVQAAEHARHRVSGAGAKKRAAVWYRRLRAERTRRLEARASAAYAARPRRPAGEARAALKAVMVGRGWVLRPELMLLTGYYQGLVNKWLDQLWREGAIEKQLNPSRAADPRRAIGAAGCKYRFRLAVGAMSEQR